MALWAPAATNSEYRGLHRVRSLAKRRHTCRYMVRTRTLLQRLEVRRWTSDFIHKDYQSPPAKEAQQVVEGE